MHDTPQRENQTEEALTENSHQHSLVRARYQLGPETEIIVLSDGTCQFDGGAMFGVVPKALWSRSVTADEQNRVSIGLNTVVVRHRSGGKLRTVVVETGFGEKLPPKLAQIYGAQALLPQAFAQSGIALASVDMVINTHLHWDHCGWNTRRLPGGNGVTATFPNAVYHAHAGEIAHGRARHERDAVSYVAENYEPLLATGQMEPLTLREGEEVDLSADLAPGISVELFPGHTRHLMAVHIRDHVNGNHACYISDLVPTVAHLPLTWGLGFDLDPMRTIEEKKRFYARAIAEQWLVLLTHEPGTPGGTLDEAASGAKFVPRASDGPGARAGSSGLR